MIEWFLGYERKIRFLGPEDPKYGYEGDAGYDLYTSENTLLRPQSFTNVPTGVYIEPTSKIWFEIRGRSSSIYKLEIEVQGAVIDNGYRGELFAIVYNPTKATKVIEKGQRICQIIPHLLLPCRFERGGIMDSERSFRGFGSTG